MAFEMLLPLAISAADGLEQLAAARADLEPVYLVPFEYACTQLPIGSENSSACTSPKQSRSVAASYRSALQRCSHYIGPRPAHPAHVEPAPSTPARAVRPVGDARQVLARHSATDTPRTPPPDRRRRPKSSCADPAAGRALRDARSPAQARLWLSQEQPTGRPSVANESRIPPSCAFSHSAALCWHRFQTAFHSCAPTREC